ncbi:MAG: type II toxin-antitoxin system PemK/MazF family toxin [Bryobacterales bacterium]|nr:type II toxin-antitoxin system PemK/MazF family toxin [Bryobacterales bacterium]
MATHKGRAEAHKVGRLKRGEIYLVDFDPTIGAEIRKTRPVLVIQNDIGNENSPITIVAAITSKFDEPPYPTEVVMEPEECGLPLRSAIVLNQIRSIDRQRLVKRIGRASGRTMGRVDQAIRISLGLIEF